MYFSNVYDVVLHSENVTCTHKSFFYKLGVISKYNKFKEFFKCVHFINDDIRSKS